MDALASVNLSWAVVFLIQTTAGIIANSLLFCLYHFPLLTAQLVRPTNLVVNQLVISNYLVLFSKGLPQTVVAFGLKSFLDEAGCKVIIYVYRVSRGVSLSTTSLLSGFQVIKVCYNTSGWAGTRIRSPMCIGTCCFLCWILHLLLNIIIIMDVTGTVNSKTLSAEGLYRYCSSPIHKRLTFLIMSVIYSLVDITSHGHMAWASGSMVLVLHRHKQRVHHIHSHSFSQRPSHEDRATHTILVLVSMFISFYSLASIFSLCITQTEPKPLDAEHRCAAVFGLPSTQPPCAQFQQHSNSTVLLCPLDKENKSSHCGLWALSSFQGSSTSFDLLCSVFSSTL
uniref:Vomeronasal type-1 receptor n=1 Tax=Nannospalax galili TaxID=1026970 RepID=A0A4Y1N649_NANGA|nr:vomeronasal type 1 receptor 17 [Nannospalax galili]